MPRESLREYPRSAQFCVVSLDPKRGEVPSRDDARGSLLALSPRAAHLPGVDAIFVGPNDLTAQMRTADGVDPAPAELEAMLQRVLAAGKKVGTPVGLHVQTIDEVNLRIAQGWQFLAIGSELRFMTAEAQRLAKGLNLKKSADLARY